MGRLVRRFMRTSRMIIARTSSNYTITDGAALQLGTEGDGGIPYAPLTTALADTKMCVGYIVSYALSGGITGLKLTTRVDPSAAGHNVNGHCAEFVLNIHDDVGTGVGNEIGSAVYAWTYLDNHAVCDAGSWSYAIHGLLWVNAAAVVVGACGAVIFAELQIAVAMANGMYCVFMANNGAIVATAPTFCTGQYSYYTVLQGSGLMWDKVTDRSGGAKTGCLKVQVDGADRWIQLYA